MRIRSALVSAGSLALAATLIAAPAQAGGHGKPPPHDPHVIAEGLVTPLSLDLGRRGDVYVTQNFAGILSTVDRRGAVSAVHRMTPPAAGAVELAGVAYHQGSTYHVETVMAGTPATSTSHIVRTSRDGTRTVVSEDLLQYEERNNPDQHQEYGFTDLRGSCRDQVAEYQRAAGRPPLFLGYTGIVESHAYQLEVHDGTIYVADAAANAVLTVNERTKKVRSATVIPASPTRFTEGLKAFVEQAFGPGFPSCTVGKKYAPESVPTDVVLGRRGELFVSTLQGAAGEVQPLSTVHRIEQRRGPDRVTTVAGGMHGVTGLDRASNGDLYVAEMFGGEISVIKGSHIRHAQHGAPAKASTLFTTALPADVTVNGHHLYATVNATAETGGSLVRYHLKGRR